jgi:hypothetical protein
MIDFARAYGHENAFIRSNAWYFYNAARLESISPEISSWWLNCIEGLGLAGLAAPLLFAKKQPVLYIASTVTADYKYPLAAVPAIDNAIAFAGIRVIHDAFELSRLDKLEFLARFCKEHDITYFPIKVCSAQATENCNRCAKCLRTINGLLALGHDYRAYGFTISQAELESLTHELIVKAQERKPSAPAYLDAWNLQLIQDTIRERSRRGDMLSPYLEWLLHADLGPLARSPQASA